MAQFRKSPVVLNLLALPRTVASGGGGFLLKHDGYIALKSMNAIYLCEHLEAVRSQTGGISYAWQLPEHLHWLSSQRPKLKLPCCMLSYGCKLPKAFCQSQHVPCVLMAVALLIQTMHASQTYVEFHNVVFLKQASLVLVECTYSTGSSVHQICTPHSALTHSLAPCKSLGQPGASFTRGAS